MYKSGATLEDMLNINNEVVDDGQLTGTYYVSTAYTVIGTVLILAKNVACRRGVLLPSFTSFITSSASVLLFFLQLIFLLASSSTTPIITLNSETKDLFRIMNTISLNGPFVLMLLSRTTFVSWMAYCCTVHYPVSSKFYGYQYLLAGRLGIAALLRGLALLHIRTSAIYLPMATLQTFLLLLRIGLFIWFDFRKYSMLFSSSYCFMVACVTLNLVAQTIRNRRRRSAYTPKKYSNYSNYSNPKYAYGTPKTSPTDSLIELVRNYSPVQQGSVKVNKLLNAKANPNAKATPWKYSYGKKMPVANIALVNMQYDIAEILVERGGMLFTEKSCVPNNGRAHTIAKKYYEKVLASCVWTTSLHSKCSSQIHQTASTLLLIFKAKTIPMPLEMFELIMQHIVKLCSPKKIKQLPKLITNIEQLDKRVAELRAKRKKRRGIQKRKKKIFEGKI